MININELRRLAHDVINTLRARIEEMERQEPAPTTWCVPGSAPMACPRW